jgi:hypothetical protein
MRRTPTAQIGRLIRKTERQPRPSGSRASNAPPSSWPTTAAMPWTPPRRASGLPRRAGGNSTWTIEKTCGSISAAPAPWRQRKTISEVGSGAAPQAPEATPKAKRPTTSTRRRP